MGGFFAVGAQQQGDLASVGCPPGAEFGELAGARVVEVVLVGHGGVQPTFAGGETGRDARRRG